MTLVGLERTGVTQIFFRDPDNIGVELNFAPASSLGRAAAAEGADVDS